MKPLLPTGITKEAAYDATVIDVRTDEEIGNARHTAPS